MTDTGKTRLVCVQDYCDHAVSHLDSMSRDFIEEGAERRITLRENITAFQRYRLLPRVLRDVSKIDTSTRILGHKVDFPVGLSPTSTQKLAHPRGEIATAEAAASRGVLYTMSSYATSDLADVSAAAPDGLRFFQLYLLSRDRESAARLIRRVEASGYRALVLTVDLPVIGVRYSQKRNKFILPPHLGLPNMENVDGENVLNDTDASLTWDVLQWIRSVTTLPIVLKGILSPADAALAVEHGVAAVWVSNHGGRQLDTVPATIDVLEGVVRAVAGRCEVYMDGGVRCGTDVFKALALGADAVFIGRPAVYGLAYDGAHGVQQILDILKEELRTAMALSGCSSVGDIGREFVIHKSEYYSKL